MTLRYLFFLSLLLPFFPGCMDEKNEYNERPKDLKGNIYQMLQERGNYNYFLQAAKITGYSDLLDGGGLVTVFAPDDQAFKQYLQEEYGTDSLAVVPENDLKVLVAYHMVEFAYTTDDFLAFSPASTADNPSAGDGSCFKYKSLAREGLQTMTNPVGGNQVHVFSQEKYLPVISTRLFENRKSPDPEKDYKAFFPEVNWQGDKDRLYVCNAAVKESGLPSVNGYLYTLDKVVKPLPTIYAALSEPWAGNYSLYKKLFDRFSCFEYRGDLTKNYAQPGDSLFLFWHYKKPQAEAELPEIASEWSYHDENGKVYEDALRYAVTCFAPNDGVLESFLIDYFKEFGTLEAGAEYLDVIPNNALFHFLQAHAFDKKDLMVPSQIVSNGITGNKGEKFELSEEEINDIRFCANGVVYGMNKYFVPAVFTHLARPLFQYPQFKFFSLAFNVQGLYQQTVDPNNRYCLFILDDETLADKYAYRASESTTSFGTYQFQKNRNNMKVADVANLILANLVYGDVSDLTTDADRRRYYVTKDQKTYFYTYDGLIYNEKHQALNILDTYDTENGVVYYVDKLIEKNTQKLLFRIKQPDVSKFGDLLRSVGLLKDGSMTFAQNMNAFFPTNEAVTAALEQGFIPELGPESTAQDTALLVDYVKYYFVPIIKNKLDHYLLPGLGPEGVADEPFTIDMITSVDYQKESQARRVKISWEPETPSQLILEDGYGTRLYTKESEPAFFGQNGIAFLLDECFDYREILK